LEAFDGHARKKKQEKGVERVSLAWLPYTEREVGKGNIGLILNFTREGKQAFGGRGAAAGE